MRTMAIKCVCGELLQIRLKGVSKVSAKPVEWTCSYCGTYAKGTVRKHPTLHNKILLKPLLLKVKEKKKTALQRIMGSVRGLWS